MLLFYFALIFLAISVVNWYYITSKGELHNAK